VLKSQARLWLRKPEGPKAIGVGTSAMITVAGKPFRCSCGANVFTKRQGQVYEGRRLRETFTCNGCRTVYA
jgi:hypothetical protein